MDAIVKDAPRQRRLRPDARRQQILDAAVALLADRGTAFNTRELAEAVGVSHPLLFRYFTNKDEIIEAVFQSVFLGRFTEAMREGVDRAGADPVTRWCEFYTAYAPKIFDRTWIRIFISSALQDEVISRRYFDLVILPLILRLAQDTERHCLGRQASKASRVRLISLELAWMTHSSLFYSGLRKWVYGLEVPDDIEAVMTARVRMHFAGAAAAFAGSRP
jgi:AcrR family transcriptional regulator